MISPKEVLLPFGMRVLSLQLYPRHLHCDGLHLGVLPQAILTPGKQKNAHKVTENIPMIINKKINLTC